MQEQDIKELNVDAVKEEEAQPKTMTHQERKAHDKKVKRNKAERMRRKSNRRKTHRK